MDVADDVEWTVFCLLVVPQRCPGDRDVGDRLGRLENVDLSEALSLQPTHRPFQLARLVPDDVRPEVAVGPRAIAVLTESLGKVEHDRDRQEMMLSRETDERLACLRLDIRRVDDGEPASSHPLSRDVMEQLEGVVGRVLSVLVVRDQTAAEVG